MTPEQFAAGLSADPEVIVFNLKRRFSGVSATIDALVPLQIRQWRLGFCGHPLSNGVPGMTLREAIALSRRPPEGRPFRIWHVRRDPEMIAGIFARDVLRLPIRLVFTSAAQHLHGRFARGLIARMDAVIATTAKATSFVPNTTAVVPHGIDLARYAPPADKFAAWAESGRPGQYGIGLFGRIRPTKGTDIFVDAMIEALPQLPGASVVMTGLCQPRYAEFERGLRQKIEAAGLSSRMLFTGEIETPEVLQWYQRCLVCVACPRYEPFGLTPFEAAASGCALVCSRTGAFEELVEPGIQGELVPTGDAHAVAEAVLSVLRTPEHAQAMGQRARERVTTRFSLEAEAGGIGRVYEQLWQRG
ncbi:MAG: Glycogen synthase [Paracidovorax wautersii]|uniref:Glycogen synthase n=1 Tax=Paracidovorax wautersii TaxID=1177982 RepID=A0A7V8FNI7_9BURK|nr:MAG: Glycogen synthase [Paracidovorax wautersii]